MERADGRPTFDAIAREAYAIYLAEGATDGRDLDHWLEAERRLAETNAPPRQPGTDLQHEDRDRQQEDSRERQSDRDAAIL